MSERLASKLKHARHKLNMTQKEFAEAVGVPLRTIIAWENEECTPKRLTTEALLWKIQGLLAER